MDLKLQVKQSQILSQRMIQSAEIASDDISGIKYICK